MILVMVDGRVARIAGSLKRMSVVDAPGKKWDFTFRNWTYFIIESPIMAIVGVNRGSRGGDAMATVGGLLVGCC